MTNPAIYENVYAIGAAIGDAIFSAFPAPFGFFAIINGGVSTDALYTRAGDATAELPDGTPVPVAQDVPPFEYDSGQKLFRQSYSTDNPGTTSLQIQDIADGAYEFNGVDDRIFTAIEQSDLGDVVSFKWSSNPSDLIGRKPIISRGMLITTESPTRIDFWVDITEAALSFTSGFTLQVGTPYIGEIIYNLSTETATLLIDSEEIETKAFSIPWSSLAGVIVIAEFSGTYYSGHLWDVSITSDGHELFNYSFNQYRRDTFIPDLSGNGNHGTSARNVDLMLVENQGFGVPGEDARKTFTYTYADGGTLQGGLRELFYGAADGALEDSGTLTVSTRYEIVVTTTDYFGAGLVAGDRFTASSALALSAANSVRKISDAIGTILFKNLTLHDTSTDVTLLEGQNGTAVVWLDSATSKIKITDGTNTAESANTVTQGVNIPEIRIVLNETEMWITDSTQGTIVSFVGYLPELGNRALAVSDSEYLTVEFVQFLDEAPEPELTYTIAQTDDETRSVGVEYSVAKIDDSHVIVALNDAGTDGEIATFSIDGSGVITELNTLQHEPSAGANDNSIIQIDSTHFALAYQGLSNDGYIKTFSIDGSYNITEIDSLEHDTVNGRQNSLILLDSTHLVLAYQDGANAGRVKTFSIDGSYNLTEIDSLQHDIDAEHNSAVKIDDTHFALAYSDAGNDGILKTFSVDGSYNITQVDSYEYDTTDGEFVSLVKLDDSHLILAYSDASNNGVIKTFSFDGSYNITFIDDLTHDTGFTNYSSLTKIDNNHAMLAYKLDSNGIVKTFNIDGSYAITEIDSLTHGTCRDTNSLIQLALDQYVLGFSTTDNNGHVKTFGLT